MQEQCTRRLKDRVAYEEDAPQHGVLARRDRQVVAHAGDLRIRNIRAAHLREEVYRDQDGQDKQIDLPHQAPLKRASDKCGGFGLWEPILLQLD